MKMLLITLLLSATIWSGEAAGDLPLSLSDFPGLPGLRNLQTEEEAVGKAPQVGPSKANYELREAADYGVRLGTENGVSWIQMKGLHGARLIKDGRLVEGEFNTSVYFEHSDTTRIFYADRKRSDLDPTAGFDYIYLSPSAEGAPAILLPNPFRGEAGEH